MGQEIERKFLVVGTQWRSGSPRRITQAYLNLDPERTVRVRVADDAAWLTIKGRTCGAARVEFEYPLPLEDARQLLELCHAARIEKTRWIVPHGDMVWEVDEFHGSNAGLVVAEVELQREDQSVELPPWIGTEVTQDRRYLNANLLQHPFRSW